MLRLQRPAHTDLRRLVPRAGDDERPAALAVQHLEAVVDLAPEQDVVEPGLERLLVQVGVTPRDRILETPVGAEGWAFGLDGGRHSDTSLRCGSHDRPLRGRLPSLPR